MYGFSGVIGFYQPKPFNYQSYLKLLTNLKLTHEIQFASLGRLSWNELSIRHKINDKWVVDPGRIDLTKVREFIAVFMQEGNLAKCNKPSDEYTLYASYLNQFQKMELILAEREWLFTANEENIPPPLLRYIHSFLTDQLEKNVQSAIHTLARSEELPLHSPLSKIGAYLLENPKFLGASRRIDLAFLEEAILEGLSLSKPKVAVATSPKHQGIPAPRPREEKFKTNPHAISHNTQAVQRQDIKWEPRSSRFFDSPALFAKERLEVYFNVFPQSRQLFDLLKQVICVHEHNMQIISDDALQDHLTLKKSLLKGYAANDLLYQILTQYLDEISPENNRDDYGVVIEVVEGASLLLNALINDDEPFDANRYLDEHHSDNCRVDFGFNTQEAVYSFEEIRSAIFALLAALRGEDRDLSPHKAVIEQNDLANLLADFVSKGHAADLLGCPCESLDELINGLSSPNSPDMKKDEPLTVQRKYAAEQLRYLLTNCLEAISLEEHRPNASYSAFRLFFPSGDCSLSEIKEAVEALLDRLDGISSNLLVHQASFQSHFLSQRLNYFIEDGHATNLLGSPCHSLTDFLKRLSIPYPCNRAIQY